MALVKNISDKGLILIKSIGVVSGNVKIPNYKSVEPNEVIEITDDVLDLAIKSGCEVVKPTSSSDIKSNKEKKMTETKKTTKKSKLKEILGG